MTPTRPSPSTLPRRSSSALELDQVDHLLRPDQENNLLLQDSCHPPHPHFLSSSSSFPVFPLIVISCRPPYPPFSLLILLSFSSSSFPPLPPFLSYLSVLPSSSFPVIMLPILLSSSSSPSPFLILLSSSSSSASFFLPPAVAAADDPGPGPAGAQQLLVVRDPFDELMGTVAVGLLAGMAAGAAMRSFLLMPFFFC